MELTICEGPSMVPTIRPRGEIVVMDRFTPRWYGLQGGSVGEQRKQFNIECQKNVLKKLFLLFSKSKI